MSETPKSLPGSFIPSLQKERAFKDWLAQNRGKDRKRRELVWAERGTNDYERELNQMFGAALFDHCQKQLEKNNGKLKIVSFGGGELTSLLDLRMLLIKTAEKKSLPAPEITIVEYALTKKLAHSGIEKLNAHELVRSGALRVHIGPLEVKNISDAAGADVEISRYGPFYHAATSEQLYDLVEKAVRELAPGGRAFLHAASLPPAMLRGLKDRLDSGYTVEVKENEFLLQEYYDITKNKPAKPD